jgi:hypothetical protein
MSEKPKNDDLKPLAEIDGWSEDDSIDGSEAIDVIENIPHDDSPDDVLPDDFGLQAHPATHIVKTAVIDDSLTGLRFDQVAAALFSEFSREKLKEWMLAQ